MTTGPEEVEMTAAERWKNLSWHKLAELPEQERDEALVARLNSLAELSEGQRWIELRAMALITSELSNDEAVALTRSRLRAWLKMNPQQVEVLAASYEIAMGNAPADIAWKRIILAQHAVKHLSPEEQHKLHLLFPKEVPEVLATSINPSPEQNELPADKPRKRTWWPFTHWKG